MPDALMRDASISFRFIELCLFSSLLRVGKLRPLGLPWPTRQLRHRDLSPMELMPDRSLSDKPFFVHSLVSLRFMTLDWRLVAFCTFSQIVGCSGNEQGNDDGAYAYAGFGAYC